MWVGIEHITKKIQGITDVFQYVFHACLLNANTAGLVQTLLISLVIFVNDLKEFDKACRVYLLITLGLIYFSYQYHQWTHIMFYFSGEPNRIFAFFLSWTLKMIAKFVVTVKVKYPSLSDISFATDCPCDVWCRGLTTCLLHVGPPFENRILNNSWAVGLT